MSISLRSNADGSGTLLNGSTPVMEITAAGVVSLPNIAAGSSANQPVNFGQVLGVGQTWQNVTASRALGVTYTNSTGKPIMVWVEGVTTVNLNISINGVSFEFAASSPSNRSGGSFIIPPNNTYVVSGGSFNNWLELR